MLYEQLKALVREADKTETVWELRESDADGSNDYDAILKADAAYTMHHITCRKLSDWIVEQIGCDKPTANEMAFSREKRAELLARLQRRAG